MKLTMRLFLKKEHKEMIKADPVLAGQIPDDFSYDVDPFDPVIERLIQVLRDSEECLSKSYLMVEFNRKELAAVTHFEIYYAKELKTTSRDESVNERELLNERAFQRKGGVEPVRIMKPYRLLRPKVSPEGIYDLRPGNELLVGSMVKECFAAAGLRGYTLEPVLELNSGLPHEHCWQLWSETYIGPVARDGTDYRTNPVQRKDFQNFGYFTFEPEILAQMADFGRTFEPLPHHTGYPSWIISRRVAECHRKAKLGRWGLNPVLASGSDLHRAYLDLWNSALERVAPLAEIGGGYNRTWNFENDPEFGRELIDYARGVYDKAPDQIELLPEPEPKWHDPDRVCAIINNLIQHGFKVIATFRIRELPHIVRTALYHPDKGWQALVGEFLGMIAYAGIDVHFENDKWLEVSNSPSEGYMPPCPGDKRLNHRAYTIDDLMELAQRETVTETICPITPANFAACYKESHKKTVLWGREFVHTSRENAFKVGKGIVKMQSQLQELQSAPAPEAPPIQEKERQGSLAYFQEAFAKAGLTEKWPEFAAKARPEILLDLESTDEKNLPVGCTKIGGRPDLSPGIVWPRDADGNPLSFLAQINFAEIATWNNDGLLPESGIASFFYAAQEQPWGFDPGDSDKGKVLFFPGPLAALKRASFPRKQAEEGRIESCRLSYEPSLSLPAADGDDAKGLLSAEQLKAYGELNDFASRSKLLGWADTLQGDMELQCELVSNGLFCGDGQAYATPQAEAAAGNPAGWRLLLQLDSEAEAGMTWGDAGRLYFWIREEDLRQRCFDQCRVILQCG